MNMNTQQFVRGSLSLADAYVALTEGIPDDDILDVIDGMFYALCRAVDEDRHIFLNYEIWPEKRVDRRRQDG